MSQLIGFTLLWRFTYVFVFRDQGWRGWWAAGSRSPPARGTESTEGAEAAMENRNYALIRSVKHTPTNTAHSFCRNTTGPGLETLTWGWHHCSCLTWGCYPPMISGIGSIRNNSDCNLTTHPNDWKSIKLAPNCMLLLTKTRWCGASQLDVCHWANEKIQRGLWCSWHQFTGYSNRACN